MLFYVKQIEGDEGLEILKILDEFSFVEFRMKILKYLWETRPKSYETIRGVSIPYLRVSPFLLKEKLFHSKYSRGEVWCHKLNGTTMIFIAGPDKFWRYTVYHEYWEGKLLREKKSNEQIFGTVFSKIQLIREALDAPSPEFISEENKKAVEMMVNNYHPAAHVEAIFEELLLAKEELSHDDFIILRKNIMDRLNK
jgi:hypothetical protein